MKKLVIGVLVMLAAVGVRGEQISVEQALSNACDFVNAGAARMPARVASVAPQLAYTATQDGVNAFYVFNFGNKGFVIAAADDCAAPVLGYSDAGAFDPQAVPDNMRAFLEAYQAEIAAAVAAGAPAGTPVLQAAPARHNIEPLLGTVWSQGQPFNAMCPMDGDYQCVVGCVATAMSQIMYYHKYPAQGSGSNTYTTTIGDEDVTLSLDFSSLTFDWDDMLPSYRWDIVYTDEQAAAVAELSYAAGVAVNMMYGSGVSLAYSADVPRALCQYFGYNRSMRKVERMPYTTPQWEDILYNELAAARPIYYDGQSSAGGHAFVCDGYQEGGYFHMNWGWGGMSNGYFRISALNPEAMGIGGSGAGFNCSQSAVININPADTSEDYSLDVSTRSPFVVNQSEVNIATDDNVPFDFGMVVLSSTYDESSLISLGVQLTGVDVNYCEFLKGVTYRFDPPSGYFNVATVNVSTSNFSSLADATYIVRPAYECSALNKSGNIDVMYGCCKALRMTKSGDKLTFVEEEEGPEFDLSTDDIEIKTPLYVDRDFYIGATITNNGDDFDDAIIPLLVNTEFTTLVARWDGTEVNLRSGEQATYEFAGNFADVAAGDYLLVLAWYRGTYYDIISPAAPVTITANPTDATELQLVGVTYNGVPIAEANVCAGIVDLVALLKCTTGYFTDWVFARVGHLNSATGKYRVDESAYIDYCWVTEGKVVEVPFTIEFVAEPGDDCCIKMQYCTDAWKYTNEIQFYVGNTTGVSDATADAFDVTVAADAIHVAAPGDITALSLYNASGIAVRTVAACGSTADIATDSLPAGIYIVSVSTASATHTACIAIK
ncbi:MAG: thiol protease/hemagglutinin PrtT [Muribaculaceae bacterium]